MFYKIFKNTLRCIIITFLFCVFPYLASSQETGYIQRVEALVPSEIASVDVDAMASLFRTRSIFSMNNRIWRFKGLFNKSGLKKIYSDRKTLLYYKGEYSHYNIYVKDLGTYFYVQSYPCIFVIYVDYKSDTQAENPFLPLWQQYLDNPIGDDFPFRLDKHRRHFSYTETNPKWNEFRDTLPTDYTAALKQDVYKTLFCVGFPDWIQQEIVDSFGEFHQAPFDNKRVQKKFFYIDNSPPALWTGTIWEVSIDPAFIACYTDGKQYRLASPDMANLELGQFFQ